MLKRTTTFAILVLIVSLGLTSFGHSEFYKYKDKSGTIRFTDDLSVVPPNQRPGVKEYRESAPTTVNDLPGIDIDDETLFTPDIEQKKAEPIVLPEERFEALEVLKAKSAALTEEYKALEEESDILEKGKDTMPASVYNKEIDALNKKMSLYEEKRVNYEESLKLFNERQKQDQDSQ